MTDKKKDIALNKWSKNISNNFKIKAIIEKITRLLGEIWGYRTSKGYLKLKEVDRILTNVRSDQLFTDIGGGYGLDALLYSSFGTQSVVVDISLDDLKIGMNMAKKMGNKPRISYILADARYIPLKNHTVDVAGAFSAIEHLPSKQGVQDWIREMARICKVNGEITITTSNKHWILRPWCELLDKFRKTPKEFFITPQELISWLNNCQYRIIQFDIKGLYWRKYWLIPPQIPYSLLFNEFLERIISKFERFKIFKKISGRMGARAKHISNFKLKDDNNLKHEFKK